MVIGYGTGVAVRVGVGNDVAVGMDVVVAVAGRVGSNVETDVGAKVIETGNEVAVGCGAAVQAHVNTRTRTPNMAWRRKPGAVFIHSIITIMTQVIL